MKEQIQRAFSEIHADDNLIYRTSGFLRDELYRKRRRIRNRIFPALAGFCAFLIIFTVAAVSNLYFSVDAYISIDVNPSVELSVNRFSRVVDTRAFNEEGAEILTLVAVRGKLLDEAAELLVSAIENGGYLTDGGLISVTIQAKNTRDEEIFSGCLMRAIDNQISVVQDGTEIEIFPVTAEVLGNAHDSNVSPAKYLAIMELMEVDDEATIEEYSTSCIQQIRERTRACHDQRDKTDNSNSTDSESGTHSTDNTNDSEPTNEPAVTSTPDEPAVSTVPPVESSQNQGNGHHHGKNNGHGGNGH